MMRMVQVGVAKLKAIGTGFLVMFLTIVVGVEIWMGSTITAYGLGLGDTDIAAIAQFITGALALGPVIWVVLRYPQVIADQRKAKHYQAWQTITSARGKRGSLGRIEAIEELNKDRVSLTGVELTGGAWLEGVQLRRAGLQCAVLDEAALHGANLERADLSESTLRGAVLLDVNLRGANLRDADLEDAVGLTREQILSTKDRRGAKLPSDFRDLEVP